MITGVRSGNYSVPHAAYARLHLDLLSGRLPPGSRLRVSELCRDTGFNASAVRDALTRLNSEGLVVETGQGLCSSPISRSDFADLIRARIVVESLCVHGSVVSGDLAWETGLMAAEHTLLRTPRVQSTTDGEGCGHWRRAHDAFHRALCDGCGNSWLLRIRDMLYVQSERYRQIALADNVSDPLNDSGHHDLLRAAIARDADRAVELIEAHITATASRLASKLPAVVAAFQSLRPDVTTNESIRT